MKALNALCVALFATASLAQDLRQGDADRSTRTPIKHLVVVVGENVSFDTLFATYVPPRGQSVLNLLSQGIVTADGSPGRNYAYAVQHEGSNRRGLYTVPPLSLAAYSSLPQPTLAGVFNPQTLQPFGLIPDPRFGALSVNGPFQITRYVGYNDLFAATEDPVHRFFQMWQQTGGTNERLGMFAWVTINAGTGGDTPGVTPQNPGQGAGLMGFFNMAAGDAPFFKQLAQSYTLSDNYHQSIMGGTGANFFALATGGELPVYNVNGALAAPPPNQIENPDPLPRSANFYIQDGLAGGAYVNCSDASQPGVAAILEVLQELGTRRSNCRPGAYYLVNNYEPPFNIDGTPKPLGANQFTYPPQTTRTIGEALSAKGVSWKWYTGGRDTIDVVGDPLFALVRAAVAAQLPPGFPPSVIDAIAYSQTVPLIYNSTGDPLNGSANVVGGPLRDNLKGLDTFYRDVAGGTLPAVSFVVPKNLDSGHPGYSTVRRYELFVQDLIQRVQSNAAQWQDTAVLITTDEGGGYFDSGYIQNLDFFGDGPRIPFIVMSPHAKKGHVDHVYQDHASILKFIERNWRLPPLSSRSRDRLPNPEMDEEHRYRPRNSPAVGDLMTLFDLPDRDDDD
jgi:phospholipase C